jgi:FKBP-type peptidyl-prolyl cis-trans isomerase
MRILTTVLAASVLLLASCNKFEKTKSGMPYKITGNSSKKIKQGEMIKMNISFSVNVNGKDSILNNTFGHVPAYFVVDSARFGKYNFTEVLFQCGIGDKLDFKLSIDTLKKMGGIEYNKTFKRGGFIVGKIEFLKNFATEAEMTADYKKEEGIEKDRELKDVEAYAAKKKYTTAKTPSGTLVVIENAGEGAKADSGKLAEVYYTGTLMTTGTEFDSNVKGGVKGQVLPVTVGTGGVIKGMDEGLRFFAKGGKGKLLIPAMLAYGGQPSGPIPAYSNLVFDIEVADVKDAPAPQPMQPAPVVPGQPSGGEPKKAGAPAKKN